jgi:ABC-type dipeptide/oligopeptide/nickel transport system permease subunit
VWDARARKRFLSNRGAVVGAALVLLLVLFAALGPLLSGRDPLESDFARGVAPSLTPVGPSADFPVGADRLFRDVFVRLAYGARLSLVIALASTLIACAIGGLVGILAGYYEGSEGLRIPWVSVGAAVAGVALVIAGVPYVAAGAAVLAIVVWFVSLAVKPLQAGPRLIVDTALMRTVDIGLSFPFLLLVMAIGAALDRTTAVTILVTLGLTGWLGTARVVRAKTLQVRSLDFIVASRALGQSTAKILLRHVLPNVAGPLIVIATVSVAQMILAESVLSYLGVGISPPTPTWGRMLFEGQDYYQAAPWLILAPGAAILIAVFGFNLLGEGLRDALDPKED